MASQLTPDQLHAAQADLAISQDLTLDRFSPLSWGGGCLEISGAEPDQLRALGRRLATELGCRYAEPGDPTFEYDDERDQPAETGLFFNGESLVVHPGRYLRDCFAVTTSDADQFPGL